MGRWITDWLTDSLIDILNFYLEGCSSAVAVVSIRIPLVDEMYSVFVGLCGILLVCIVLFRIFTSIIGEAERSSGTYGMEPTISIIIIDTIKSGAAIPIMVFIQGLLHYRIIYPLTSYLFSEQSGLTAEVIKNTSKVGGILLSGFTFVLFLLFFSIVFLVFFIKMSKFYVELAFFTLATPIAAISIATTSFDFSQTWWRKLLYLNLSLLSQVLCLTLMIYAFNRITDSIMMLMLLIGSGALIFKAPSVIEDFFSSSGSAKKAGAAVVTAAKIAMGGL